MQPLPVAERFWRADFRELLDARGKKLKKQVMESGYGDTIGTTWPEIRSAAHSGPVPPATNPTQRIRHPLGQCPRSPDLRAAPAWGLFPPRESPGGWPLPPGVSSWLRQ